MFTLPLQRMIHFSYIKNKTLFFVLNHPAAKQEFDNSIDTIKSALKFYMPPECSDAGVPLFNDIKAFVTHTPKKAPLIQIKTSEVCYEERSSGNFAIPIHDAKLHALVESIQKIIQEMPKK